MLCRSSWPNEQLLGCAGRGCLGLATAAKCAGHVESHLVNEEQTFQKDGNSGKKKNDPKAVVFVPYTPNSALAKELRIVEESMEILTGTRLKIVEKAGIQLKRILVKSNPWAGSDCQREDCLICQTREETGEGKGKACWKRNVI